MKLLVEQRLPFPRQLVFCTYRDRLVELVPELPNIRSIAVQSRRDDGPRTELVNLWRGGGEVPAVARAVLSEKMLSWTDYATWDEATWSCAWRMEAHAFKEAVHAAGTNTFHEDGAGCRLVVAGDLTIDGRALPVPRLLAGTIGATVEKFLGALIRPNLTEVGGGVARFLAAQTPR